MEKPFLTDPGYFIHLLEVVPLCLLFLVLQLCILVLYGDPLSQIPATSILSTPPPHPTPSNVFEINKTIEGA